MTIWEDSVVYNGGQQYGGQVEFNGDVNQIQVISPTDLTKPFRDKYIDLAGISTGNKFEHGIRTTIDNKTFYGNEAVDYGGGWEIDKMFLGETSGIKTIIVELYKLIDEFVIYTITFDIIVENEPPWELYPELYPDIDFVYELLPQIYRTLDKEYSQDRSEEEQYALKKFCRIIAYEAIQQRSFFERFAVNQDIDDCPKWAIPLLAVEIGAKINATDITELQRNQVKNWVPMLKVKGTRIGITTVIKNATGWESELQTGDAYIFTAFDYADPTTYDSKCMDDQADADSIGSPSSILRHIWGRGGTGPAFIEIYIYGANTDPLKGSKDEHIRSIMNNYIPVGSSYLIYYIS